MTPDPHPDVAALHAEEIAALRHRCRDLETVVRILADAHCTALDPVAQTTVDRAVKVGRLLTTDDPRVKETFLGLAIVRAVR